jgi:hypothetical protein
VRQLGRRLSGMGDWVRVASILATGAVLAAAGLVGPVDAEAALASQRGVTTGSVSMASAGSVPLPNMGSDGEWWFTTWKIPEVWATGARGQGMTVAVDDSGVQASFPELRGVVLPGNDFRGGDGRTDGDHSDGNRGHGTAMAIDIAGQGGSMGLVGVAPAAKILPVVNGYGSSLVQRIRWAIDHGAKVINISHGIASGSCSQGDRDAIRFALEHGAVVVAASGNEGLREVLDSPANCPGVLTVGAFDEHLVLWSQSNQGSSVAASAPGVNLPTITLDRHRMIADGTSDAAALTSGAVALVWSKFPNLTNRQVVARLLATTRDKGPSGRDDGYGYGLIRPYFAIATNVPEDAPNSIFDAAYAAASPSASAGGGQTASSRPGLSSSASGSSGGAWLLLGGGIVLVLVVGGIVSLVLMRSSRRRPSGTPGPLPGGTAGPPRSPGFPGYPPVPAPPGYPASPPSTYQTPFGDGSGQPPARG